ALPAPYLPQMSDDGFITESDLQAENAIFAMIPPYHTAAKYDSIRLFFQGQPSLYKLIEDPDKDLPFVFHIPANDLPDGVYTLYYTVTDVSQNTSLSPLSLAILIRNGSGTLPPPQFIDAVDNVLDRQNILSHGGTHIHIPNYPLAQVGDKVTLTFYVKDENNNDVPSSQFTVNHDMTESDVSSGVTLFVPERYLLVVAQGNAFCLYSVSYINGNMETSGPASAHIDNSETLLLPPPIFLDGEDGLLTEDEVSSGVRLSIAYPNMLENDALRIFLRGFTVLGLPVPEANDELRIQLTASQASAGEVSVIFPRALAELVVQGWLDSDYTVTRSTLENLSETAAVRLNLMEPISLPPPIFTEAIDGILLIDSVIELHGTPLRIAWPQLAEKDVVTIILNGYDREGQMVAEASYQEEHTVTAEDEVAGLFTLLLPENAVLAVGESGKLEAQYWVMYAGNAGFAYSLTAEVILMKVPSASSLTLVLATGAPIYDNTLTIRPRNHGKVYGPAGASIALSCSSPAWFTESGTNTMTATLNQDGEARFSISSTATGEITVLAVDEGNSQQSSASTAFSRYKTGSETPQIRSWGKSSGSVADGSMICSIYLVTENLPTLTKVHVQVIEGSATLRETGATSGDLLLHPDKSVAIEFVDTLSEDVTVRLSLPESTGNTFDIPLHFVAEPTRNAILGEPS
ncbi:TPA: hypothetical protein ACS785_004029, partial [Providencia alcalifaciens]